MPCDRPYPVPETEAVRLTELSRYAILDTAPEPVFNDVVRLARSVFGVESSALAFVDSDRQWFKARVGISFGETPRGDAFCSYTILTNGAMIVPDATLDSRFRDNNLVVRAPHIRFYAGAPLTTPAGSNIGTLCVIDSAPRADFCGRERKQLEKLADVAMSELDRRLPGEDRRSDRRLGLALAATISGYGVAPTPVQIANLSARGAMIRGLAPGCHKGDDLILTVRHMVAVATIAWIKDDTAGLAFHCPVDPLLVARLNGHAMALAKARTPPETVAVA